MSMTKAQLLDDLREQYKFVGIPEAQQTTTIITPYVINVLESGLSEGKRKPTGFQKNIVFYVYDEGGPGEEAYYAKAEPVNTSNTDITASTTSGLSYYRIFMSQELRARTQGFMLKAVLAIVNEAPETVDHAKRLLWAYDMYKTPTKYLEAFMVELANNATVRTSGNLVSDQDLEWLINSAITNIIAAFSF